MSSAGSTAQAKAALQNKGQAMASKAKSKSDAPKASDANTVTVIDNEGKTRERKIAELSQSPIVGNANTAKAFAQGSYGTISLNDAISAMREKAEKVRADDLSDMEDTLTAQAVTLDTMFNELARRAAQNMGTYLSSTEIYLRLAFKAQAQCRATLETLAEVKYPKAATFVRQQNVAYQQQVNNGDTGSNATSTRAPAHAHGKSANQSNELLEAQHGERLDSRTQGTASGNDSHMEAVETVNRPKDTGRKGARQS